MSTKTEQKEAPAEKPGAEKPAGDAAAQAAAPPKQQSAMSSWIPAVAAVLLAPVASVAVAQFVLFPRFVKKLGTQPPAAEAAPAESPAPAAKAADGKGSPEANTYEFTNVVVNLSGTMGTRYLKTTFTVTGPDGSLKQLFETNKPRLTDVTLNVLSALSMAELEEPGSKNVLRDRLVASYNQALGKRVVDQIYFGDFLIQ